MRTYKQVMDERARWKFLEQKLLTDMRRVLKHIDHNLKDEFEKLRYAYKESLPLDGSRRIGIC